jgi:hypothetical protein
MYGEGGVVLEAYNRVAATVTAVSVWVNRNKNNHVISARATHIKRLALLFTLGKNI